MLDAAVVQTVRRLLADGIPQRQIARQLAGIVSRTTIGRIANGTRRDPDPPEPPPPSGPAQRCPGCGRLVAMPCVACAAEAYHEGTKTRKRLRDEGLTPLFGLDLKPAHQARYEEVRRGPDPRTDLRAA